MGKITSLIEFNGTVGNLVGYRGRDGRNVVRFKVHDPRNPQTTLQMRRRVSWANLVNLWAAITPYMHPSFNHKPAGQTDFNAFMAENVGLNPVFLTKKQARQQFCIASPIKVTDGDIPSVSVSMVSGGKFKSSIAIGSGTIDAETTIGGLSHNILEENPWMQAGDQITGLMVTQKTDAVTGKDYVEVLAQKFILDESNYDRLYDELEDESGDADAMFSSVDGCIATKASVNGGVCWIVSRIVGGETKVSSQTLVVNNNILSTYTSGTAQQKAMNTYGVNDSYLTPTGNEYSAAADNPEP